MSTLPEQENGPSVAPAPQAGPASLPRRSRKVPLLITGAVALTGVAGVAAYQATRRPAPAPATADWGTGDESPSPSPGAASSGHGGGWWFFHGGGWGGSSSSIGREASGVTSRGGFGATGSSHASGSLGSV